MSLESKGAFACCAAAAADPALALLVLRPSPPV
jgi:hypothetical protein